MKAAKRGDIFLRHFTSTKPPKDKFFVVIGEDESGLVGFFFINSNINQFVQRHKLMLDMQMPIKPENYGFLKYFSYVAGHELAYISKELLISELESGRMQMKGRLTETDLDMLLDAALESPLFSEHEKQFFK